MDKQIDLHRELEVNCEKTTMNPYEFIGYDGRVIDPTGGKVEISCFDPSGDAIAGVKTGIADSKVTFTANTTDGWRLGEYYHAEILLEKDGETWYRFFYFDVVVFKLPCLVEKKDFAANLRIRTHGDLSRIIQLSRATIMRKLRRHIQTTGVTISRVRAILSDSPEMLAAAHLSLARAMANRESAEKSDDAYTIKYKDYYAEYELGLQKALAKLIEE